MTPTKNFPWTMKKKKIRNRKEELERLKRRKVERLESQKRFQEERDKKMQLEMGDAWMAKEVEYDLFELNQSRLRAKIRAKEGRGDPLDCLMFFVLFCEGKDEEIRELGERLQNPLEVIDNIPKTLLVDTHNIAKKRENLDTDNQAVWKTIVKCIGYHLYPKSSEIIQMAIKSIFSEKTIEALENDKIEVQSKINDPKEDTMYWERMLVEIDNLIDRMILQNMYNDIQKCNTSKKPISKTTTQVPRNLTDYDKIRQLGESGEKNAQIKFEIAEMVSRKSRSLLTEEQMMDLVSANVDPDDEQFLGEISEPLDFTLKKPEYFNRVIMGYQWNTYNRVHYDKDQPPPKNILGYKFHIFYPELLNKAVTPTFKVYNHKTDVAKTIIRFIAGPPYQDISFQIQNLGPWNTRPKQGYRCEFDRGILYLHFRFRCHIDEGTRLRNQRLRDQVLSSAKSVSNVKIA